MVSPYLCLSLESCVGVCCKAKKGEEKEIIRYVKLFVTRAVNIFRHLSGKASGGCVSA